MAEPNEKTLNELLAMAIKTYGVPEEMVNITIAYIRGIKTAAALMKGAGK